MNTEIIENISGEEWRDIKGYENLYQVSNKGKVKSLGKFIDNKYGSKTFRKEKILKPQNIGKGYLFVGLSKEGIRKLFLVHRLVAQAFLPNPDNLPQCNHLDENKHNNCVNNLSWLTSKENINYGSRTEKCSTQIKCLDLETNKETIFPSINEAARQMNVNMGSIWHKLYRGKNNIYKNRYIFSEA